jgi:hypothetical protein
MKRTKKRKEKKRFVRKIEWTKRVGPSVLSFICEKEL